MNNYAVVTGATSGIGKELVYILANNSYPLILIGRNEEKLNILKKELVNSFNIRDVQTIVANLANEKDVEKACEQLIRFDIEILINNAGFDKAGAFIDLNYKEQQEMVAVNVLSLTHFTHIIARKMINNKYGRIMNIGSVASFMPNPLSCVYAATKSYVLSFSEALYEELKGSGVSVTTVCPGPTKTQFAKVAQIEDSKLFKKNVMCAEKVAQIAFKAMNKGKIKVIPGLYNKLTVLFSSIIPIKLVLPIARKRYENIN